METKIETTMVSSKVLLSACKTIILDSDMRHVDRTAYVLCKLLCLLHLETQEEALEKFYDKNV